MKGPQSESCPRPGVLVAWREGVLPEELESWVGQHLESCPLCAVLRRDLRATPFSEPGLAGMESLDRRVLSTTAAATSTRRIRTRGWMWAAGGGAIAATGLMLAVLGGGGRMKLAVPPPMVPAPSPVYRLVAEPAPLRLPLRMALPFRGRREDGAPTDYLAALGRALEPYRRADYAAAAMGLTALGQRYPNSVEPAFYEGVARLLAADVFGALAALQRAKAIGGEALDDDIAWYLAAAWERAGRWDEGATPLLRKLCGAEGPRQRPACGALESR